MTRPRAGKDRYRTTIVIQLFIYVGFALGISFLCSLLEATLLSARLPTLSDRKARGSRGAARLLDLKKNRVDDAISAILILNTAANTLGATMAGARAAHVFGSAWVGVFSGILTLLILVISEIIPKTLGAVYAPKLAPFTGTVLQGLTWIMRPVLTLTRGLTGLLRPATSRGMSRGELAAVISMASREGAISGQESEIFANLLRFHQIQVEDVMTPRTVVAMMPAEATVADLLANREAESFSRIPIYRDRRDNVVGYVLQRDILKHAATNGDRNRPLDDFRREVLFVPELISVSTALRRFLERREALAMVTDEHGGISGLVTLEDLTETILGVEIVDESDRVVDLRQVAAALRDRRLERIRRRMGTSGGS